MTSSADAVRDLLRARGCPSHVVDAGLDGLVGVWVRFADELVAGYPLGLDDYLNEVDVRQLLAEALAVSPADLAVEKRVVMADDLFRAATEATVKCLWGETNAERSGYNAERNWWYFALPNNSNEDFLLDTADLKS